ncbi:MAG TPA: hypothetical protein VMS64_14800 [Candidatus Methylomirabilis sp.]|nr:hypothetical protein [Candidatus Methylomirabilis sp.]
MKSRHGGIIVFAGVVLIGASALALWPSAARADLMIIGNDDKVVFDAEGNRKFAAPGKDTVSIVDITNREAPKILVSLPLMNSIFGPPYVGNFIDRDVSILKVDGTTITDTGKKLQLPGQPASMRGRNP